MNLARTGVCYLCGRPLVEPMSSDHVPPRQIFASAIRKAHRPNLLTIRVHDQCNRSYQYDEDYFVNSLAPFARGSYSGDMKLKEIVRKHRAGQKVALVQKVLKEFEPRPSGLVLPANKVAKRFEGVRIKRIAWKIVRGLHFHHHGECYPADWTVAIQVVPPGERPPDHFLMTVWNDDSFGRHEAVFDYKFRQFPDAGDLHYWALLLWDRIIIIVMFHDFHCTCNQCQPTSPMTDVSNGNENR